MRLAIAYWPIIAVVVSILILILLVAAVYMSMCPQNYMTGILPDSKDKEIKQHYLKLASTDWDGKPSWNAADRYLVEDEPFKKTRLYPQKVGENKHDELQDKFRNDFKLRLKWSDIHSVLLYKAVSDNTDLPFNLADKVAEDLHPYFYYIERTESISTKEGSYSWPVRLLVEAHTIHGWFQYHYVQKTKTYSDGSTYTYWDLQDTIQLYPDKNQFFKDYIAKFYNLDRSKPDDISNASEWILQASEGFFQQREWVEWLTKNFTPSAYASQAMIPAEYWSALEEAEQKFGIPSWFMAALIEAESSWNPLAVNASTGCFGLSQFHPDYYETMWTSLGFDPVTDKWNPRAQILAGAKLLKDYSGRINWDNWQEDSNLKKGLVKYGGFENEEEAQRYIQNIFALAENLSNRTSVWPVNSRAITSYFWEPRETGPHRGIDIACPENSEVRSVSAGIVFETGYSEIYGNYIIVRDTNHQYRYAHLNQILVNSGDVISPGQRIALSGNTGNSTGPHLHLDIKNMRTGNFVNPLEILFTGS